MLDSASLFVGAVGGVVVAATALWQMKLNRDQRAQELRWKQASVGKELIDGMHGDRLASAAMRMLDWSGREFEVREGAFLPIRTADVLSGLRTTNLQNLGDTDAFIRDCFDSFFFHVYRIEQSIRTGLTTFEDVRFPLDYYGRKMRAHAEVYANFMHEYQYTLAADLYATRLGMPFAAPAALPPPAGARTLK